MEIKMLLVCILLVGIASSRSINSDGSECHLSGLAQYNLTFEGLWSEEDFPKQFPLFRPNAQWSKVLARSHSDAYVLWRFGEKATSALREFTEKKSTELFEKTDEQGVGGILDLFQVAPIRVSVGEKWATFYADDEHHKLSIASKIVPSPDWFVGIDSFDLCNNNDWIDYKIIDLDPIDAGTDQGFTFTAPNWMETHFRPIFKITSTFPSHPANSFFYPDLEYLPPIARVVISKLKTYEKVEDFQVSYEDNYDDYDILEQKADVDEENAEVDNNLINENELIFKQENLEEEPRQGHHEDEQSVTDSTTTTTTSTITTTTSSTTAESTTATTAASTVKTTSLKSTPKAIQANSPVITERPLNDFIRENAKPSIKKTKKKHRKRNHRKRKNRKNKNARVNCVLGDWAEWASCSKTCGYGVRTRQHQILIQPRNGGAACKQSPESELCGSMRTCSQWKHFSFENWGMPSN